MILLQRHCGNVQSRPCHGHQSSNRRFVFGVQRVYIRVYANDMIWSFAICALNPMFQAISQLGVVDYGVDGLPGLAMHMPKFGAVHIQHECA